MGCLRLTHNQQPELRVVHGKKGVTSNDRIKRVRSSYLFGMLMPDRHDEINGNPYTYGFQGQERDDEVKGAGNAINYKYRMHDPRLGRFFAIDPLFEKYPFYSPYAFSGNRVIDAIEQEGLQPGVLFSSPDEAANDFGMLFNDNSIRNDKEYGTKIYKVVNAGDIKYSYSIPVVGSAHKISNSKMNSLVIPDGATWVGWAHTHGAESGPRYDDNNFSGAPGATLGDIGWSEWKNKNGYVATPDGSLDKYDVVSNKISEVNQNQPQDDGTGSSPKSLSVYKIQKGDTLGSIAKRYHTTIKNIADENKIENPDDIKAGDSLNITN